MHQPTIAEAYAAVDRSILLTGVARSGTSMMGQLLHSLERVQYVFEPPVLYRLLELNHIHGGSHFRPAHAELLETYLYAELLDLVLGRRNNARLQDSSNIHVAKGAEYVSLQHLLPDTPTDATEMASGSTIVWKMPDIGKYLPGLMERYPGLRVVVMLREREDVEASLLDKGWYRYGCTWVYDRGEGVPFWFDHSGPEWRAFTEEERCAEAWSTNHRQLTDALEPYDERTSFIPYRSFVTTPTPIFAKLALWLGLKPTEHTMQMLRRVYDRQER